MLRAKRALTNHPLMAIFGGLLIVSLVAASVMAEPSPQDGKAETQTPSDSDGDSDGDAKTADGDAKAEGDEEKEPTSFAGKLDKAFGDWVVKPLTSVLFYDFGSASWLGASVPLVVAWLAAGAVFFTVRMLFINFRAFWHAIRLTKGDYDDPSEPGEVSHFQALASALSATVGLGNIAGVAIAIGTGGPGAVIWIAVVGLLGMSMKFVECSLGQMYRKVLPDGTVSGGPMHYLKDGLANMGMAGFGKVLAFVFAVFCILASLGGGNTFQVVQAKGAVFQQLPESMQKPYMDYVYGGLMAFFVGIVIIGGIKRIGAAAGKIVPLMCGLYVTICLYIIFANIGQVGGAFKEIWDGAFTQSAAVGGLIGTLVIGIQRAVFSNEAGVGSASIAHSAARTDEPISEGIVALLEPFIDTVVICTMTALVIVLTDACNVDANQEFIKAKEGASLTAAAWKSQVWWFPYILAVAVTLFAYSTLISWSYYGERCSVLLFGQGASIIYRVIFVICAFLGALLGPSNVLDFSDLMIFCMAFVNVMGIALLSGQVKRRLDDYWSRYKKGELEPDVKYNNS